MHWIGDLCAAMVMATFFFVIADEKRFSLRTRLMVAVLVALLAIGARNADRIIVSARAADSRVDCLGIGDSIMVGMRGLLPGCRINAVIGINSTAVAKLAAPANVLLVSMGSNWPTNPHLTDDIRTVKQFAPCVVFVAPVHPRPRSIIMSEALPVIFTPANDNVHPQNYRALAAAVNAARARCQ